jgi:penicillin-binding protein 1A
MSVTDPHGNEVLKKDYKGEIVLSEENACIMTKMLENVIKKGTATTIKLDELVDCAGKTGTTQDNCDRWYIGYTPYYVGGIWYGYEYPKPLSASTNKICIETWDKIMTKLHQKYISENNLKKFSSSENIVSVEYCKDSGALICEACEKDPRGERSEIGYFVKGTEPKQKCKTHTLVRYDEKEECIASNECNNDNIILVGMIKVERSFPTQIYITDAQYVWRDIGKETLPETSNGLPFFNNLLSKNEYSGISNVEKQFNSYCRKHFNYQKWKER